MFCSAAYIRDTHESPKIVCWLADTLRECSKLGKTRIIEDADIRLARNAAFFDPDFQLHSIEIEWCDLFILFTYLSGEAAASSGSLFV